jgi:hypothetical protein
MKMLGKTTSISFSPLGIYRAALVLATLLLSAKRKSPSHKCTNVPSNVDRDGDFLLADDTNKGMNVKRSEK